MSLSRILTALFIFTSLTLSASDNAVRMLTDSLPQRWEYYPSAEGQIISLNDNWWTNFEDEVLDSLVQLGLRENTDIRTAHNNINIALNTYRAARSSYFPTLSVQAGWDKSRVSATQAGGTPSKSRYWTGEIGVSWQIDLFGKITQQANAKKSLYQVSQAEWAGTMLTVISNIINEYIDLRVAQLQLTIMQQHAESQLEVVEMVLARQKAGVASMLDVAQSKTVYYSTLANIPVYENTISNCINSLAVLTGTYPQNLPKDLFSIPADLPNYQQFISVGIPMDLLRRRPDVIEAEKTIASYAAQLGVAKKDFLPTLTLEGTISTTARDFNKLFSDPSFGYTIAPSLQWNFFTGGEQIYNVRVARETLQNEINTYNYTVMNAVEETNNALSMFHTALEHIRLIDDVVQWARKSLNLSVELYRSGLTAFSNVVDAQESVLEYETQAVAAREDALLALVEIYSALGGGWDASYIK